jgi:hypothetical protein
MEYPHVRTLFHGIAHATGFVAAIGFKREQARNKAGTSLRMMLPQRVVVDTEVAVYQPVAGGDDEPPRNLRIGRAHGLRDMGVAASPIRSKLRTVVS